MKCQAGSRHKTPGSLLMQWSGRLLVRRSDLKATPTKSAGNSSQIGQPLVGLVAICKPLHTTPVREIHMDGNMFIGRIFNSRWKRDVPTQKRSWWALSYDWQMIIRGGGGKNAAHLCGPSPLSPTDILSILVFYEKKNTILCKRGGIRFESKAHIKLRKSSQSVGKKRQRKKQNKTTIPRGI